MTETPEPILGLRKRSNDPTLRIRKGNEIGFVYFREGDMTLRISTPTNLSSWGHRWCLPHTSLSGLSLSRHTKWVLSNIGDISMVDTSVFCEPQVLVVHTFGLTEHRKWEVKSRHSREYTTRLKGVHDPPRSLRQTFGSQPQFFESIDGSHGKMT